MLPAPQPSHRLPSAWPLALDPSLPEALLPEPLSPDTATPAPLPLVEVRLALATLAGWRLARRGRALVWSHVFPDRPSAWAGLGAVALLAPPEEPTPEVTLRGTRLVLTFAEGHGEGITPRLLALARYLALHTAVVCPGEPR